MRGYRIRSTDAHLFIAQSGTKRDSYSGFKRPKRSRLRRPEIELLVWMKGPGSPHLAKLRSVLNNVRKRTLPASVALVPLPANRNAVVRSATSGRLALHSNSSL